MYAVDASNISERARQVVRHNGLSDVIEVIQSKGEELCLPEQVDLIISEWMGTLLLVSQGLIQCVEPLNKEDTFWFVLGEI